MAKTFDQAVLDESAFTFFSARNAKFDKLEALIAQIQDLKMKGVNTRSTKDKFYRLQSNLNELSAKLKDNNESMCTAIFMLNKNMANDLKFKEDQTALRTWIGKAEDALSELVEKLEESGMNLVTTSLQPPPVASDIATILLQMSKQQEQQDKHWGDIHKQLGKQFSESQKEARESQAEISDKLAEKFTEALKVASKPKFNRIQPTFSPKRDINDAALYREFKREFGHFIADMDPDNWADKTRWILKCVKDDAYELIKLVPLNEAGYNKAFEDLDSKYLCKNKIKDNIFNYIHMFAVPNTGKNHSTLSSKLIALKNYIQDLTDHYGFEMTVSLCEFIGHIILKGLPNDVKKQFYLTTATLYPDYNAIMGGVDEVIETLNKIGLNTKDSTMKQNPNNSNNNASKSQSINSVTNQPTKSSKSAYRGKGSGARKDCRFCKSSEHKSVNCTKYLSSESRIAALRKLHGSEICHKCTLKHTDKCKDRYFGRCYFDSCKSNPHHRTVCPIRCKAASTKLSQTSAVGTVVELPVNATKVSKPESPSSDHLPNTPEVIGGIYINGKKRRSVCLETLTLTVFNDSCSSIPVHEKGVGALLDSGAQRTMITTDAVNRLGIQVSEREAATLQGFGNQRPANKIYDIVKLQLGKVGFTPIPISALVVKNLGPVPMVGASAMAKRIAKYTKLADYRLLNGKSDIFAVDILIGNDNRSKFLSKTIRPKQILGMWLDSTIWGDAILSGPIPGSEGLMDERQSANIVTVCNVVDMPLLNDNEVVDKENMIEVAKHLNNLENLGINVSNRQEQDEQAVTSYKTNVTKDPDTGSYIVGFPWAGDKPPEDGELDSNYHLVKAKFKSVMATLDKNKDKLRTYAEVHKKEMENKFIELVPLEELNDPEVKKHFIYHFPVWKSESCTTSCRRVFDASFHKSGRASLNDLMLKGSQLTPHILKVLLKLRLHKVLLCSDISKAFLRMALLPRDRNFTCFFARENWEDPDSKIQVWRFSSVLFGATSSPFLLNCTVKDILEHSNYKQQNLEIFVDNLFVLLDDEKEVIQAAENLERVFKESGMPLHEFASNSDSANKIFNTNKKLTDTERLKTLGLFWDYKEDNWYLNAPEFHTDTVSKRGILSDIARIFDPLGFLNCLTVFPKILIQDSWNCNFNWDSALPEVEFAQVYRNYVVRIQAAIKLPIPRWVGLANLREITLHCFTDASERALGVVIYLVAGHNTVFYTSKAKVCPNKQAHFSIPRKELTGLSLGVRYVRFVCDAISKYTNPDCHIWSDSTTALNWVNANSDHKDLYIRDRVADINKKLKIGNKDITFHFIVSEQNPADLLTKDKKNTVSDPLWLKGPEILCHREQWLPYRPTVYRKDTLPIFCGTVSEDDIAGLPNPSNYGNLRDLYSETVKCHSNLDSNDSDALNQAEILWVKYVQEKHYPDIISFLLKTKSNKVKTIAGKTLIKKFNLSVPQLCASLQLFLDSNQIIRVYTSAQNMPSISYEQANPILLPKDSEFSKVVAKDAHNEAGHMGLNYTIYALRKRFWVPKHHSLIYNTILNCQICVLERRGQRLHVPESPPLPEWRFDTANPWLHTNVDMTGHYFVKSDNSAVEQKVYLIIFVCMATGSGHIEVVHNATSSCFAEAVGRFINRCGAPSFFHSDQGSNFKGYSEELKRFSKTEIFQNFCHDQGIQWVWTPIGAPHMNGLVERYLGMLKTLMKKVMGNKKMTISQLETVATYAQCIFNERPLTMLNSTDEDFIAVTPNMLVFGRSLRHFSHNLTKLNLNDPDFKVGKDLSVMARKLRSNLAQLRKIWINQYFSFLISHDPLRRKMSPANKSCIIPEVNQYVLIKDDSDLKLGRILKVLPSQEDQEIRSCLVKTKHAQGVYPTNKLRYLEGYAGEPIPLINNEMQPDQPDVLGRKKLPRDAKAKARERLEKQNLHLVGMFLSTAAKENWHHKWNKTPG